MKDKQPKSAKPATFDAAYRGQLIERERALEGLRGLGLIRYGLTFLPR